MASRQASVDFIVEQMSAAGDVSARKMFGEYALYCDGKLVALVCDDQLFIKPTPAGRAFAGACPESPPYKGAKPSLLMSADQIENAEWLSTLVRISAAELPQPKIKTFRKKAPRSKTPKT